MILIIFILFNIVCICDSIRDYFVIRTIKWLFWHIIKWIAFFIPLIFILYLLKIELTILIILSIDCSLIWHLTKYTLTKFWRKENVNIKRNS